MAATAPTQHPAPPTRTRAEKRRALIEAGELVPNAPLRERFLWLLEHDPEFTRSVCCHRLAALGYPSFVKPTGGKHATDGSRLDRTLGIRPQRRYRRQVRLGLPGTTTTHIEYPLAVALCQALEMDPVDGGV